MDLLTKQVEHLTSRDTGWRQRVGLHIPDGSDPLPGSRIIEFTIARQLISFLALFAAPLAIALAGQAAVATAGLVCHAQCQHQVYQAQVVIHARGLLFNSAATESDDTVRRANGQFARV